MRDDRLARILKLQEAKNSVDGSSRDPATPVNIFKESADNDSRIPPTKELNKGMARLSTDGLVQSEHFIAKYIMTALMELGLSKFPLC